MSTTTTLMTELEAVNLLITATGEAPVQALNVTGLYPLDQAKSILDETSRVVQAMGWAFNTDEGYTLARDGSGLISLPANTLKFDPDVTQLWAIKPVQRGTRLYDSKAHSYVFTQDVKGTITFLLEWTDLPQAARHYIAIRAARTMQGRNSVPDSVYRYSEDDEKAAMLGLSDLENTQGNYNMVRDSESVAGVIVDYY